MSSADADVEQVLKVLSNPNRLQLLRTLQSPKAFADLDLAPSRNDGWGSEERSISRQAVRRHVQELLDLGVVVETPAGQDQPTRFLVNHARLFGIVEQLRQIATVRPTLDLEHETMGLRGAANVTVPGGPHLALVRGVQEGRAFALAEGAAWTLGRTRACSICLDYDPYVSSEHAQIVRKEGGYFLVDLAANKNGTFLNWAPMTRGGVAPLKAGDVIGVGMSLLVFRA